MEPQDNTAVSCVTESTTKSLITLGTESKRKAKGKRSEGRFGATAYKSEWTADQDDLLRQLASKGRKPNWVEIANNIQGKTSKECRYRLTTLNKSKSAWTLQEDLKLMVLVRNHLGSRNWTQVSKALGGKKSAA
jgi:hypothetical protein